jgi:hypothetical protein
VWPLVDEQATYYDRVPGAPDTMHVYGGWDAGTRQLARMNAHGVEYHFHSELAGYMRQDGAGLDGPPLFGFTRRRVLPGHVEELASTFEVVCELWRERVPGILAATVSRDPTDAHVVHEVRIMANHAAYAAHVDKSDTELSEAMGTWFGHYDTSVPFVGELYAADTSDEALHTSSIKPASTPRAQMASFHFGRGMLGPMPDMTRNDE